MKKRLFIVDEDASSTGELREKLADSQHIEVCGHAVRLEEVWRAVQATSPDILLVSSLQETELGVLCQQIRFAFPHLALIAACSARELLWEPFLRNLGIWVIAKPIQPMQIETLAFQFSTVLGLAALQNHPHRAVAEARAEQTYVADFKEPKHLITVYGPKGGVGKTFLSRELAVYFSMQKKAGRPLQVLAVDFNLDLGTFATSLNLPRTPNLFSWVQVIDTHLKERALRDGRNPDLLHHEDWQEYATAMRLSPQDIAKYVVTHSQTGLHVLTSPREIRHSFEIRDYHLYLILETLKNSSYDVILIDTAPDTTDATIQALFFAERVVMVGNPVVDSIENIQRMLKLLREAEYPEERIQICMNRLQRKELFTLDEIRAYFQLHPSRKIFPIPDDAEVKKSINTGTPMMLYPGRTAAKDAIEALGKSLVPPEAERVDQQEKGKQRPSLLKWLWR
ncbi:AAA family ATPase [Brevibacillus sp. H7]|uniref:AAA family ATPase n=1 Tax=Brevibacillus sp. H7 TaxID=3349138 RepID=UPI0038181641